ncbi:hypothetical protein OROMI_007029 [Orobanche minor]
MLAELLVNMASLWDEIRRPAGSISEPWVILGDFNNVLLSYDRVRGLLVIEAECALGTTFGSVNEAMEKGRTPSRVELFDKVYARSDGNSSSVVNEILLQIAAQKDILADIESPRYTSAASNNVTRSYTKTTTLQEGRNVLMMSMIDMKKIVAKGVLLSDDPKLVVGGYELGDELVDMFCCFHG